MNSSSQFLSTKSARISTSSLILVCLMFCSLSSFAQTQPYKSAVGLKLSYYGIATLKTFLGTSSNALELGVGTRGYYVGLGNRWTTVTGAYLIHRDIDELLESLGIGDENITAYFGGGVSMYFWSYRSIADQNRYGSRSFGVQAYGGAEYRFEEYPFVVGLEYSPRLFFGRTILNGLGLGYGTVTVKYILGDN